MSRLSNSRLEWALRPGSVRLRVRSGWRRPVTRFQCEVDCVPGSPLGAAFEQSLAAAATELSVRGFRGWPVDVEIANALAHFDVVEGAFADQADRELQMVAKACVQELMGEEEPREVRFQLQQDERHLLICAIDCALINGIREAVGAAGLSLRRIETAFGIDWNLHAKRLQADAGAFVSRSGNEATGAIVRQGVLLAMASCTGPDLLDDPQADAPSVDGLCNSIGLHALAVPTRLDALVLRMAGSLGLESAQIENFVAVTNEGEQDAMSSRWETCIERESGV